MTKNAEIIVDGEKYITIKKAAIYLELNCGRIRELLKNKRVKYHKAPSRIYILKKDIFEYKAKCDNIRDNYYPLLKASQLANMDTKYFYKIVKNTLNPTSFLVVNIMYLKKNSKITFKKRMISIKTITPLKKVQLFWIVIAHLFSH